MTTSTHNTTRYAKLLRGVGIFFLVIIVFGLGALSGTQKSVAKLIAPARFNTPAVNATANSQDLSEFWYVWNLMESKYPFTSQAPSSQNKIYGAIEGLVSSYGDPYTEFFPPEQAKLFNDQVTGSFGGVGLEVGMQNGLITVIAPIKGSASDLAGIKSGDVISEINGQKTADMDIDTAISMIRGTVGTTVDLGINRAGDSDIMHFTLTRATVNLPVIDTSEQGDVFIISLYSFSENSADLFKAALQKFQASGKQKLVIDLRDNPGGYLDAAVDIGSYFLPQGKVIVREDSGGTTPEVVDESKGFQMLSSVPKIVVLINGGSASASEILAGALSQNGVATLVGTTSFGKGSVQQVIELPDGSAVKITVAKWLTPNGTSISEKGITPDVVVDTAPVLNPKTNSYSDPQMDAAIKILDK